MGFGLSGSDSATLMVGADPTIAWVDPLDGPQAVDYYLSAYTQVGINIHATYFKKMLLFLNECSVSVYMCVRM